MSEHAPKLLAGIELFSELTDDELSEVSALAQTRTVVRDTTIFNEGDTADAIFVVVNGRVKIVTTSTDGKEFILTVLGAGQVFGCHLVPPAVFSNPVDDRHNRLRLDLGPAYQQV